MLNESTIDNVLVAQKNELYITIWEAFALYEKASIENEKFDLDAALLAILAQMEAFLPLWGVLGYAYKGWEICDFINANMSEDGPNDASMLRAKFSEEQANYRLAQSKECDELQKKIDKRRNFLATIS